VVSFQAEVASFTFNAITFTAIAVVCDDALRPDGSPEIGVVRTNVILVSAYRRNWRDLYTPVSGPL